MDCDAILFVVDARAGLTAGRPAFRRRPCGAPASRSSSSPTRRKARRGGKASMRPSASASASRSRFSAEHGEGLGELYDALVEVLPRRRAPRPGRGERAPSRLILGEEEDGSELDPAKPLRIAVLGRPNAGKSTLINRILGEERLLTGPEPGITRDSIGLDAEWRGRKLKIFDTAGLRRKLADRRQGREARGRRRAARGALRRSGGASARRDDPVREAGPDARRSGRARGQGAGHRPQQMGPRRQQEPARAGAASRGRPALAAAARDAGRAGLGPHRRASTSSWRRSSRRDAIWNMRISTGRLNRWLAPVRRRDAPARRLRAAGSRSAT